MAWCSTICSSACTKGDMVAAQRLLTQYQSDIEAMLTQESAEAEAPTEELKAQA